MKIREPLEKCHIEYFGRLNRDDDRLTVSKLAIERVVCHAHGIPWPEESFIRDVDFEAGQLKQEPRDHQ